MRHHHAAWYGHNDLCAFRRSGCRLGGDCGDRARRSTRGGKNFSGTRRCGSLFRNSCGRCRRVSTRSNNGGRRLNGDLFLPRSRSHGRLHGNSSRGRRNNHNRARCHSPCGSFGDNRAGWRTRRNGGSCRRRSNDRGRGARLRNDLAWFRPGRRGCCGGLRGNRSRGGRLRGWRGGLGRRCRRRLRRHSRVACLFFLFLLLGQESLHYIAGLGDVRKIDLGDDGFRAVASGCRACMRGVPRFPHKVRTNLLGLIQLQRTGVRLACRNAELRKKVENRPRLYFQLFREIVDTNLTHPPLFNVCRQKALVVHSCLMALAAFKIRLSCACFQKNAAHFTPRPLWPASLLQFHFHRRQAPQPLRHR